MITWFLGLILWQKIFTLYLIVINLITILFFGLDKLEAKMNHERTSERKLWFLCLIGGSLGGLLAMNIFRHKTKKISFQVGLAIILMIQVWLIYLMIFKVS